MYSINMTKSEILIINKKKKVREGGLNRKYKKRIKQRSTVTSIAWKSYSTFFFFLDQSQ